MKKKTYMAPQAHAFKVDFHVMLGVESEEANNGGVMTRRAAGGAEDIEEAGEGASGYWN